MREMTVTDCNRIAEIRVRGWQSAYRGLIPQDYLDGFDIGKEAERRRAVFLRAPDGVENLVAEDASGTVVGWACHGPYREGERLTADAELYALYVDPRCLGAGFGRALIGESVRRCSVAGQPRMFLWVLAGNARARRFYERAGFYADGAEEPFEVAGAAVPEVRYARTLTG